MVIISLNSRVFQFLFDLSKNVSLKIFVSVGTGRKQVHVI